MLFLCICSPKSKNWSGKRVNEMEQFAMQTIGNIGVPAALCFYTLFEVNKNVKRLSDSIDRLDDNINRRVARLEEIVSDIQKRLE